MKLRRLAKACQFAKLDFVELISQCQTGECQFWDNPDACAITTIGVSGSYRTLFVMVLGGNLKGYRALLPVIEQFARDQACQRVQGTCRPGTKGPWQENNEGYQPIATVYEKVI